jgi:hypothetical protein
VRVTSNITLLDPLTCTRTEVPQINYYRAPFTSLMTGKQLQEFVVLDIQRLGPKMGKFALAEAQVARASDVGVNDEYFTVKTHLGNVLHPGDTCMGYDMTSINLNDADFDGLKKGANMPEVILVRKTFPKRTHGRRRKWTLRTLEKEKEEGGARKRDEEQEMRDIEEFQRELEEDPELRANVNIYRAPRAAGDRSETQSESGDDERAPDIPLEEMLGGLSLEAGSRMVRVDAARAMALAKENAEDSQSDSGSVAFGDDDEDEDEDDGGARSGGRRGAQSSAAASAAAAASSSMGGSGGGKSAGKAAGGGFSKPAAKGKGRK